MSVIALAMLSVMFHYPCNESGNRMGLHLEQTSLKVTRKHVPIDDEVFAPVYFASTVVLYFGSPEFLNDPLLDYITDVHVTGLMDKTSPVWANARNFHTLLLCPQWN